MSSTDPQSRIAFVLIPGSFTTPAVHSQLTTHLTSAGYTVVQAPLLSASDRTPDLPAGMHEDATSINTVLRTTLATGKSIVLVPYSYGGIPGTEAVRGLTRKSLGAGQPAVVRVVYLVSILVKEGQSSNERFAEFAALSPQPAATDAASDGDSAASIVNTTDPYMHLVPSLHTDLIFSDIPDNGLKEHYYNTTTTVHATKSFEEKLEYAGYRDVKSVYVHTGEDKIVTPEMQQWMVDGVNKGLDEDKKIEEVMVEGAGHGLVLSRAEEVAGILIKVAEGVKSDE